jgi:periplasmic protein TonB
MSYKSLLFCPDEKTARVVTQVLSELEFQVEPWNEPFAAVKKLAAEHFDAIVVDCANEQNAALLFKSAKNSSFNHQSLSVAVVEGQSGVAQAFRLGANLVLTKPINVEQAKGTLRVARGLLRKNEGTKLSAAPPAAAPPTPVVAAPVSTETMAAPAAKAPFAPPVILAPPPAIPAPSTSMFDVEEDPEIKPDLAEAALLESMPDPMAGNKTSRDTVPAGETKKQFAWQPVAKLAAPVPSAQVNAEIGKAESTTPEIGDPRGKTSSTPAPSFVTSGSGAAAATAPAKEILPQEESSAAPAFEPQTFATLGGKPERDSDGGGSKKLVLIAAVIAVAAAGAYFGWTKLHQATAVSSIPAPPAPIQSAPAPSSTATAPPQATANAAPIAQPSASKPEQVPDITLSTTETPAPKSKDTTTASPASPKTVATAQPHETLVVKSETRASSPAPSPAPAAEPVEPPAPGALNIGQASADNGINGIVSAPTSAAQPAATIKLSQGIAQGLLMKRVPPIYPAAARQARIQGAVELQATIGKDGNITNLKQSSGDKILGHAAIDAVKQWKYRPYLLDGQPVEIQTQVTVNFTLP